MRTNSIRIIPYLVGAIIISSCSGSKENLYNKIFKIDAHVHIRTEDPSIMEFSGAEGFSFLTINTGSGDQARIDMQMDYAKKMISLYPNRISYITTFSMENFEEPGWTEQVIAGLQNDFDHGAIGVKVWKDIGMTFRDSLGNLICIDDPLFDPILDFISSHGKPLLAHIGEPKNCWLPIESMTVNNDKNYFSEHPEYVFTSRKPFL